MIALVQQILIGIFVAAALSIPIGYGLARLMAIEPPWRRQGPQNLALPPTIAAEPEVSVAKLGPDIGQSIVHLVDDLDRIGIVILREGRQGKHIGVLMSVEQYELLHATEKLAKDPEHLMSLTTARTDNELNPGTSWQSVLA